VTCKWHDSGGVLHPPFTQVRGRGVLGSPPGKFQKKVHSRGGTSLSATLGFSDRHGPTEGENAMDMGTNRTRWREKKVRRCGFWALS